MTEERKDVQIQIDDTVEIKDAQIFEVVKAQDEAAEEAAG